MLWAGLVRLDKQAARLLGWSGRHTISAECGRPLQRHCVLCRVIRKWFGDQHCEQAARDEGVTWTI